MSSTVILGNQTVSAGSKALELAGTGRLGEHIDG
jgi:hypothetical protein